MKRLIYMVGIAMLLMLAGCGDIDEKNDREVSSQQDSGKEVSEENNAAEEEKEEKEKAVGVRSNPLSFGDTITVKEHIYDDSFNSYDSSLEITILEMSRGEAAWEIIKKENEFNDPAEDGYEYALVKVKGFLKDSETEDDSLLISTMSFNFVSDEGDVYDFASAVIPDELFKELYNGGTGEGYIVGQVRVGDDFKVSYDSSEGSPVFFYVE